MTALRGWKFHLVIEYLDVLPLAESCHFERFDMTALLSWKSHLVIEYPDVLRSRGVLSFRAV